MRYADARCTCIERYQPDHVYVFRGPCSSCKNPQSVSVPAKGLFEYRQGALIQKAFPNLSSDQREFLLSGTCSVCFREMANEKEN